MIKKACFIMRGIIARIRNQGRIVLPFHSHLEKRTSIYTSNGQIEFGHGFTSSTNTAFSAVDGGKMKFGERVNVNRNCIFVCRKSIIIGNHCSFGPNVCVYDHDHKYNKEGITAGYKYGEVIIEDYCWIGAGVTILRGSHIGKGCIIGAGCLIKDNIPPHSIVTMERCLRIREI